MRETTTALPSFVGPTIGGGSVFLRTAGSHNPSEVNFEIHGPCAAPVSELGPHDEREDGGQQGGRHQQFAPHLRYADGAGSQLNQENCGSRELAMKDVRDFIRCVDIDSDRTPGKRYGDKPSRVTDVEMQVAAGRILSPTPT
jgi:hypothetical protein